MPKTTAIHRALAAALLGTVIAGGVGSLSAQNKGATREKPAKAPAARVTEPATGPVEAGGDLTISLLDQVTLAFDRPGIVAQLAPREGDTVEEGQIIGWLHDEVPRAALAIAAEEAESDVDIRYAQKASEVSEAEHEKALEANRFSDDNAVTAVEILRLKLAAQKSLLEKESAEHRQAVNRLKRDEAQVQLDTFRIKAPFSGIVTRVHRSKGEAVRQGDPVLELVSARRVRIDGVIHIRDSLRVKAGDKVDVSLDIPDIELEIEAEKFSGEIRFVDVKAEPVNQTVPVWAEIENSRDILRAGLHAKMTIHPGTRATDKPAPRAADKAPEKTTEKAPE